MHYYSRVVSFPTTVVLKTSRAIREAKRFKSKHAGRRDNPGLRGAC